MGAALLAVVVLIVALLARGGGDGPLVKGVVGVSAGSGYPNVGAPDGNPFPGGSHDSAAECIGRRQGGDAQPGALVTFFGADNSIVGTAKLAIGHMQTVGSGEFCVMPFQGKLNKKSDAYQAQFANGPRVTVNPADLGNVVLDAS